MVAISFLNCILFLLLFCLKKLTLLLLLLLLLFFASKLASLSQKHITLFPNPDICAQHLWRESPMLDLKNSLHFLSLPCLFMKQV